MNSSRPVISRRSSISKIFQWTARCSFERPLLIIVLDGLAAHGIGQDAHHAVYLVDQIVVAEGADGLVKGVVGLEAGLHDVLSPLARRGGLEVRELFPQAREPPRPWPS